MPLTPIDIAARRAAHRAGRPPPHVWAVVSQFLRVIPRVSALDIVAATRLLARGAAARGGLSAARQGDCWHGSEPAGAALEPRARQPSPVASSSGQHCRGSFVDPSPIMLIDEPTASLDAANRDVVVELIAERRVPAGSAIVGIFHDEAVREHVADPLSRHHRFPEGRLMQTVLTNAKLILENEVVTGTIAFDQNGITFGRSGQVLAAGRHRRRRRLRRARTRRDAHRQHGKALHASPKGLLAGLEAPPSPVMTPDDAPSPTA